MVATIRGNTTSEIASGVCTARPISTASTAPSTLPATRSMPRGQVVDTDGCSISKVAMVAQ